MLVRKKPTVYERWQLIKREFTRRGTFAHTQMRAEFLEMKCTAKGDVREFLDGLRLKYEELSTALSNFAANQLATREDRDYDSNDEMTFTALSPDTLIQMIMRESAGMMAFKKRSKRDREDHDEALNVTSSASSSHRKDRKWHGKKKGPCFVCQGTDHKEVWEQRKCSCV